MKKLLIAGLLVAVSAVISPAVADDDPDEIRYTLRLNDKQDYGTLCIRTPNPLGCKIYSDD
jgi:hypothetical protein